MQVCHFLKLEMSPFSDMLYACAVRCTPTRQLGHSEWRARKRPRVNTSEAASLQHCSAAALLMLQSKPELADAVLTAPCAHKDSTPLTISELYSALPAELHAAAARGFFGAGASEWPIILTDSVSLRASECTMQLLPQQPRVTAVCVAGPLSGASHHSLLTHLALATQLTALTIDGQNNRHEVRPRALSAWLAPLGGWRRLVVKGCKVRRGDSPALADALAPLTQLSALVLRGHAWSHLHPISETHSVDLAELAPALAQLTALVRLDLSCQPCRLDDAEALGRALTALPSLCALNLAGTLALHDTAAVAVGAAACSALAEVDFSMCWRSDSDTRVAAALCRIDAPLSSLTLCANSFDCDGLAAVLAAPAARSLTRLCLAAVRLAVGDTAARVAAWPWEQLCALTALQELDLQACWLGEAGAAALARHVTALTQLRALNIARCGIGAADGLADALFSLPRLQKLASEQIDDPVEWLSSIAELQPDGAVMSQPFAVPEHAQARGLRLVHCWDV